MMFIYRNNPRDGLNLQSMTLNINQSILPISEHSHDKKKKLKKKAKKSNHEKARDVIVNHQQIVKAKEGNNKASMDICNSTDDENDDIEISSKSKGSVDNSRRSCDKNDNDVAIERKRDFLLSNKIKKGDRPSTIKTSLHECKLSLLKSPGGVICDMKDCNKKIRKGHYIYSCPIRDHDYDLCYRCSIQNMNSFI